MAQRSSSVPYISGDSFRMCCDFKFDELGAWSDPRTIEDGSIIFVKTDYLDRFFSSIHPCISARYILVTHNADTCIPGSWEGYLDDPKLIAWFGQNMEKGGHRKLHPIPIGIANQCWTHGNLDSLKEAQKKAKKLEKTTLLYLNFTEETYPTERTYVANLFKNKKYCAVARFKKYGDYLLDLARVKFVLSPRGNGIDCHRTWEALLMGAIPIVKTSPLDPLYDGLPVLIVQEWTDITEKFLLKKYEEFSKKRFLLERVYFQYWQDLIYSYKP